MFVTRHHAKHLLIYEYLTSAPMMHSMLISQVGVQLKDYLSTGKLHLPTIIKSEVYYPLGASL